MFIENKSQNNQYLNFHQLNQKDSNELLDYIYYYQKNIKTINTKINKSHFKPNIIWKKWNKNYFTSINNNSVLDYTSFGTYHRASYNVTNRGKNIKFFNYNINIQKKSEYFNNSDILLNARLIVDKIKINIQKSQSKIKSYLIIGAGSCLEVCEILKKFPKVKFAIIDLPEIIPGGYLTIKNFKKYIKINLPHSAKKFSLSNSQINFYFPHQVNLINGNFDCGNNIGSFQEMPITTVNKYFELISKKLKTNGFFISLNQEESRYIKNNNFLNYNLKKFKIISSEDIFRHPKKLLIVIKKISKPKIKIYF